MWILESDSPKETQKLTSLDQALPLRDEWKKTRKNVTLGWNDPPPIIVETGKGKP